MLHDPDLSVFWRNARPLRHSPARSGQGTDPARLSRGGQGDTSRGCTTKYHGTGCTCRFAAAVKAGHTQHVLRSSVHIRPLLSRRGGSRHQRLKARQRAVQDRQRTLRPLLRGARVPQRSALRHRGCRWESHLPASIPLQNAQDRWHGEREQDLRV